MEETITCQACGHGNLNTAHFCAECGSNLNLPGLQNIETEINIEENNLNKFNKLMASIEKLSGISAELTQQINFENSIKQQLEYSSTRLRDAEQQFDFEDQDVDKLERFTLTSLFAKIKGDYDEKLSKETEELAIAEEKYQAAKQDFDEISEQYKIAEGQRKELERLQDKYRGLRSQLDQFLAEIFEGVTHPEEDKLEFELKDLTEKIHDIKSDLDRHQNAKNYLLNARSEFDRAYDKLSSAGNYAAWDTFFDGGIIADSMKHSRWDDARRSIRAANRYLNSARNVLPNLQSVYVNAERTGSDFFDVWMDNIFSDFRARDQIRQSRDQVRYAMNQVGQMINRLGQSISRIEQNLSSINQEYNRVYNQLRQKRLELIEQYIDKKAK